MAYSSPCCPGRVVRVLTIDLPGLEIYLPKTKEFKTLPPARLLLEHSLRSISKWEEKNHKPFFAHQTEMSLEEFMDYVVCMTTNPQKDPDVYQRLGEKDVLTILKYMGDPRTAKKFPPQQKKSGPIVEQTSEDYYCAMAYYGIPFECANWHFNRLSALLKTCERNNSSGGGGKMMTPRETADFYSSLNKMRKAKLGKK